MDRPPSALRSYEVRDRLRDGREVLVRAVRPDDKQALQDGLDRLSAESAYLRFFRPKHRFSPQELVHFTELDFEDHVGLVAVVREDEAELPIGVGRYIVSEREPSVVAELAFAVDDAHHGLGVATLLLHHLVEIARGAGVDELQAEVMAENKKMLDVFAHADLPRETTRDGSVILVRFPLAAR